MPADRRVLQSIETDAADRCVDLFRRHDATFGFEEYRRDVEDRRGWFAIGGHADKCFASEEEALRAAITAVAWLHEIRKSDGRIN